MVIGIEYEILIGTAESHTQVMSVGSITGEMRAPFLICDVLFFLWLAGLDSKLRFKCSLLSLTASTQNYQPLQEEYGMGAAHALYSTHPSVSLPYREDPPMYSSFLQMLAAVEDGGETWGRNYSMNWTPRSGFSRMQITRDEGRRS